MTGGMRPPPRPLTVLLAAVCGCGGAGEAPPVAEAPAPTPASPPASPPMPQRPPAITACPAVLEAPESVDRTIGKGCGTVRVRKGYRVEGATLTIEAGVTLVFEPDAELSVGYRQPAKILVQGTAAEPVRFTSTETRAPGAWKGLYLYEHADGSRISGLHIEYGGAGIRGPIYVLAQDVAIEDSVIRDNLDVAVHVSQMGRLSSFRGNKIEQTTATVMLLPPASVAALTGDNQFPAGANIHVLTGVVRERVRWNDPGVPLVIGGLLEIAGEDDDAEALVEIAPGSELRFDEDAYVNVGYYRPGALRAEGTAEAPIVFTSATERTPGAWRGINLYKNASGSFAHAVFEYGSRRADWGVLFANSRASLAVRDCTFRDNGGGVVLHGQELRISAFERNRFERSSPALDASAQAYGAIGEGNDFTGESRLLVEGGTVERDARWRDLGVPLEVTGPVAVDNGATLTFDAGLDVRVRDGFTLAVGELYGGSLRMEGTGERPISLVGVHDRRGTWDAIRLHEKSRGNALRHVKLRNAGGVAAIDVAPSSEATVEHVECARCYAPVLAWGCGAEVRPADIAASDNTPGETIPPTGCGA
jgi:hypothetical protein